MSHYSSSIVILPSVICVCSPEKKQSLCWYEDAKKIVQDNIEVITLDELSQLHCKVPSNLHENELLILYPYERNRYIRVSEIEEHKTDKFFFYKEIIGLLGAKHYKVEELIIEEYDANTKVNAGFKEPKIKTRPAVNFSREDKQSLGFNLSGDFDGVDIISQASYEEALSKITEYQLDDDAAICSLVRCRNPKRENQQRKEHLEFAQYSEINKCLDVAVAFSALKIFDFSTEVQSAINHKKEHRLSIEIFF